MKNITYFTLSCVLIILINGCAGYKPIFSPTNLKFEISDYTITGDQTIGNKIYSKLYRASNVKQNEKNIMNIDISIDVLKNKKATIKNSSGKILEYKISLDTTIEVSDSLTDDNLFNKKFISSTTYKVQDQYYDTVKLENKSIENLVNKTYEEIFIKLSEVFLKNDN